MHAAVTKATLPFPTGAAHIFAPQKGADEPAEKILEAGLENRVRALEIFPSHGQNDLPIGLPRNGGGVRQEDSGLVAGC